MKNTRPTTLEAWSKTGRGTYGPRRWYYLTELAANGERLSTVRYRTRAGRNARLRRLLVTTHPRPRVLRTGPVS